MIKFFYFSYLQRSESIRFRKGGRDFRGIAVNFYFLTYKHMGVNKAQNNERAHTDITLRICDQGIPESDFLIT